MEAIRNYLETMFLNLPNTPEVYKAKNELWQMMEDKYTELKNEGKSENEAVGTVIAEFGNLDELAEDLGIKQFVHQPRQEQTPNAVSLSMEDVRQFLREHSRHSYFVALSVFLFILSACCPIFFGAAADTSLRSSDVLDASGIILMFVFIAIGVGMLVYSNVCMGHWKHLEEGNFVTDFATTDYIHHEMEHYKSTHALLLTIGIMLCILSVVPPILLDAASSFAADTLEDCSAGFVLIFVAIGVFLIVISSMRMGGYRTLLHLNNQNTIGGNYVPEQQDRQQDPRILGHDRAIGDARDAHAVSEYEPQARGNVYDIHRDGDTHRDHGILHACVPAVESEEHDTGGGCQPVRPRCGRRNSRVRFRCRSWPIVPVAPEGFGSK